MNFYSLVDRNFNFTGNIASSIKFKEEKYSRSIRTKYVTNVDVYDFNLHKGIENIKSAKSITKLYYGGVNEKGKLFLFVDNFLEFEMKVRFDFDANYSHLINMDKIGELLRLELINYPTSYKALSNYFKDFPALKEEFQYLERGEKSGMWI